MSAPMIDVTITPTLTQMKVRVAEMQKALADRRDVNKRLMVYLDQWVQHNFRGEGKKVGGWQPLAAGGRWKTAASGKRTFDPSAKILQDTGRLRISFVPFERKDVVGIGSDVPYSEQHEYGEDGLPQRRMLPKAGEVHTDVKRIYEHFVSNVVRRKKLA